MTIFRRDRVFLTVASFALLLEAVAHTFGAFSALPDDPAVQELAAAMRELRTPLGLGMEPSAWDINRSLALAMTVMLLLMGAVGLGMPAAAPDDPRVTRRSAVILLLANLALLATWIAYRVPPPLLFQAVLTPILLLAVLRVTPAASRTSGLRRDRR